MAGSFSPRTNYGSQILSDGQKLAAVFCPRTLLEVGHFAMTVYGLWRQVHMNSDCVKA